MRRIAYMTATQAAKRAAVRLGRPVNRMAVLRAIDRGELAARPLTAADGRDDTIWSVVPVSAIDQWAGPRGRGQRGAGRSRK